MKQSKTAFAALVLPALLVYSLFMFIPLVTSLGYSFFDWTGFGAKTFIGLDNFRLLFGGGEFTRQLTNAVVNNVKFFLITVLVQNVPALFLAVLLYTGLKGTKFFRTLFFVPTTISVVIVGFLWTLIYNPLWGSVNTTLRALGLDKFAIPWLGEKSTALVCVAIANAWQYMGLPILLFLAALYGVDASIIEASKVDGCNALQTFLKIQLPSIQPVIFVVTVLTFIGNFSSFEIVYAMEGSGAGPDYATDIMGTLFYRTCFGAKPGLQPQMGLGAAIAFCMFFMIVVPVVAYYFVSNRNKS